MCIKNSVILSPECLKYSSKCLKKVLNIVKKAVASKYYFFVKLTKFNLNIVSESSELFLYIPISTAYSMLSNKMLLT